MDARAAAGRRRLAFRATPLLLQPSAALTFAGGALLFVVASGPSLRRRVGVVACGLSASVCAPAGLVLALLGIADQSIERVVSGLAFVLTSCVMSLAALLAVANPVEDWRLRRGEGPMPLNRAVWILLPGVALVLLLIVLGFAMTPMQAPPSSRAASQVEVGSVTDALRPLSLGRQPSAKAVREVSVTAAALAADPPAGPWPLARRRRCARAGQDKPPPTTGGYIGARLRQRPAADGVRARPRVWPRGLSGPSSAATGVAPTSRGHGHQPGLAARGASGAAFDERGIPSGGVAPPSNTGRILGRRALPAGRRARLGATRHLHHGLLDPG